MRQYSFFNLVLCVFLLIQINLGQEKNLKKEFEKLLTYRQKISDVHPLFKNHYPIALVNDSYFHIYDYSSSTGKYEFVKKVKSDFPLPQGIRASFPIAGYDNKPSCVVSDEIFDNIEGYVTIFHEFVHCYQANTVEDRIKRKLQVAIDAMKNKEYQWEINYNFPYLESYFIRPYKKFIDGLKKNKAANIISNRKKLRDDLKKKDFEYLVWQEFKEGFARYIENKIRQKFELKTNNFGKAKPYGRIAFYYAGDKFIGYLIDQRPELATKLEELFYDMYNH